MNFYDVLTAEKWGGGVPTTNFFDLLFAQSISGGQWKTYEGTLPTTINANGADMRQYQIYGNISLVGDRTVNLLSFDALMDAPSGSFNSTGAAFTHMLDIYGKPNTQYTMCSDGAGSTSGGSDANRSLYFGGATSSDCVFVDNPKTKTSDGDGLIKIGFLSERTNAQQYINGTAHVWLVEGTTPPETFVPFGYGLDIAIGSNILQDSEIEQGGWQAAVGTLPQKIVNPFRCRSKNIYTISSKKIFYDFKSLNVNIAFIDSGGLSLGGSGFKSGVGFVDVPANAVKCLFIIANTDTSAYITPAQVIAAGIWASIDATTTPIYIGDDPLGEDEYVDYQTQKVYRMINGTLTPTDPPVTLPALPTCEGTTVIEYAGQSVAPEKVYFEYKGGKQS